MTRTKQREIKLFFLIALPLAIAALGMLWTTSRMLDGVSESVDRQEQSRTWQAVRSAFASAEERLTGTVTDNAHWDDAAKQSYGPIDNKWMYDAWGVGTADINYDTIYVVDPQGNDIVSYRNGEKFTLPSRDYFGDALRQTLGSLPNDNSTFAVITTLVNTPNGLAVMAAAPILPTNGDIKIPAARANVLILASSITADALARMSRQYIVDGLSVSPLGTSAATAYLLRDRWGNPVAQASWKARHPGDAARKSYRFSAFATILALIGVMLPISFVHARAISKMGREEERSRIAARHDSLSGLPNRVFLLEELTKQLGSAKTSELALIFVDLDGFKAVNDAYDHETGDNLIRAVAAGLSSLVKGQGLLARLGGDEFAILFGGRDASSRAETMATNILTFVKEPFNIDGRIACIGASVGIAERGDEPLEPSELMRRADIAMYDAKDGGRNRWRRFDATLDLKRSEDVSIAGELRAFVARGEFEVAYQPMVDARTRAIIGVEALARWPKSSQRNLPPDRFIHVAEEHGLIDDLGALILQIACREMSQWQELKLAVNISPLQLNNHNLVPDIKRIAGENGLPLERLEVEFTETVLIKNPRRAKQVIQELQGCGVTVALDDFGTGYASVGYLREYAFDKIKLDRSLTQVIATNTATQQVVQGTVLIAKGLSADIIAEGVETEEEAQLMRLAGCQQLQGYYFGRPEAVATIGTMLDHETAEPAKVMA
ncbi:MAG: EAL domain-containing protein [Rhizobiales bacterium]|nr:EAL domain-containing protein [Hyphomicrobiales bacterium]MBI3674627.1 EAL domain-containing protein [Hyphomicrobiales bacterium]